MLYIINHLIMFNFTCLIASMIRVYIEFGIFGGSGVEPHLA